jgi:hypothetical protein
LFVIDSLIVADLLFVIDSLTVADRLFVIDSLTSADLPFIIHSIIVADPLVVIEYSRKKEAEGRRWKMNEGKQIERIRNPLKVTKEPKTLEDGRRQFRKEAEGRGRKTNEITDGCKGCDDQIRRNCEA